MSLINKMLQDLEERRSGDQLNDVHEQLRVAPAARPRSRLWWGLVFLLLVATAALSWFLGRQSAPGAAQGKSFSLKLDPRLGPAQQPVVQLAATDVAIVGEPAQPEHPVQAALADTGSGELRDVPDAADVDGNDPLAARKSEQRTLEPAKPVIVPAPKPAPVGALPDLPTDAETVSAASTAVVRSPNTSSPRAVSASMGSAPPADTVKAASATLIKEPVDGGAPAPRIANSKTVNIDASANVSKQLQELTFQQRAENEYRRATVLMQQGKKAEAIAGLEQALTLDPLHASARQTLVGLLLGEGRSDEAIRLLQDGLQLDRRQAGLAMLLARLQIEKDALRPAIETLERSLPSVGERADYHAFLAALYQREGRHKEAIDAYVLALRKVPQSGVWWMGMGISLQADGRLAEARDAFLRAKTTATLSPQLAAFVEQKLTQLR